MAAASMSMAVASKRFAAVVAHAVPSPGEKMHGEERAVLGLLLFSEAEAVMLPKLDMVTPLEDEEELRQATLLGKAIKLPLYSVAIIPLMVGAAATYLQSGVFFGGRYWLLLGSSVLVITWLNLSNDAYDAKTGMDKNKKESVVNIIGRFGGY